MSQHEQWKAEPDLDRARMYRVCNSVGYTIAVGMLHSEAQQIVSEHNALPKMREALEEMLLRFVDSTSPDSLDDFIAWSIRQSTAVGNARAALALCKGADE